MRCLLEAPVWHDRKSLTIFLIISLPYDTDENSYLHLFFQVISLKRWSQWAARTKAALQPLLYCRILPSPHYFGCCRVMFILLLFTYRVLFYILIVLHRLRRHLGNYYCSITDEIFLRISQQLSEHKRNDNKHHIPQRLIIPPCHHLSAQIKCMATTSATNVQMQRLQNHIHGLFVTL